MGSERFEFKQFAIDQHGCAMKVGTDGVLIGAWCSVTNARRILDIGTGTGLIALMVAQRNPDAMIDAIDILPEAAECARRNIAASVWSDRITIIESPAQGFTSAHSYDLIVSNPPYFSETLQSPDPARAAARHSTSLAQSDLLEAACRLLAPQGRLAVILPTTEYRTFALQAAARNLQLCRRCEIATKHRSAPKRIMSEWSLSGNTAPVENSQLVITGENGQYSREYRELTRDFYLNF